MTTETQKFWKQCHDKNVIVYMDNYALLDLIVENRKDLLDPLLKDSTLTQESVDKLIEITETIRTEMKNVSKVSLYSRVNFKRLLCSIINLEQG